MNGPEEQSPDGMLERELWLLAMCWKAGRNFRWEVVQRWIEGVARTCTIRARA